MEFPEELRYTKDHEWIRVEADGKEAAIGITDFAQRELGDIVFVELQAAGSQLEQGEVFGTVEAVKTVSELYLPVSGTIDEINSRLESSPEFVNEDPYGEGWMIRVVLSDATQIDTLFSAAEYREMISE